MVHVSPKRTVLILQERLIVKLGRRSRRLWVKIRLIRRLLHEERLILPLNGEGVLWSSLRNHLRKSLHERKALEMLELSIEGVGLHVLVQVLPVEAFIGGGILPNQRRIPNHTLDLLWLSKRIGLHQLHWLHLLRMHCLYLLRMHCLHRLKLLR